MAGQTHYDKFLDTFWENFKNQEPNWARKQAVWLPTHKFPPEPETTTYPTTITLTCVYPECGAEYTYTKLSDFVSKTKGFVDPFVCRRPDPRPQE